MPVFIIASFSTQPLNHGSGRKDRVNYHVPELWNHYSLCVSKQFSTANSFLVAGALPYILTQHLKTNGFNLPWPHVKNASHHHLHYSSKDHAKMRPGIFRTVGSSKALSFAVTKHEEHSNRPPDLPAFQEADRSSDLSKCQWTFFQNHWNLLIVGFNFGKHRSIQNVEFCMAHQFRGAQLSQLPGNPKGGLPLWYHQKPWWIGLLERALVFAPLHIHFTLWNSNPYHAASLACVLAKKPFEVFIDTFPNLWYKTRHP